MSEQTLKDKTAKGFLWGALNNGTVQILNAVFGIVIARVLTQEDYGLVGMLLIFTTIAGALQDSGFVTALVNKKDAAHRDYNSVFWFNIGCSLMLYIILCSASPLIADIYSELRLTALARYQFIGFFISSFSIVPRAILFKSLRQKELAMVSIISLIVSGVTGVTMALCGMAYWGIATQGIVYNLLTAVLSWYFSKWRPSLSITFKPVREMFAFSSKMLVTYIFNGINNNIFSLLLGLFYKADTVGSYNQANKWNLMGSQFINGMVQGVAQPTFVQVGDDKERLRRAFRKMLRFTSFVAFPCMLGLALVAPEFITILITDKWLSSAVLMRILCVGGAFLPIATLYYNLIISRGKSDIYMWNIIAQGCTLTATACLVHLLNLNILGVSGVTLMVALYSLTLIVWTAIWHYFLWREIQLPPLHALKDIAPFLLVSVAAMLTAYFATLSISNAYLLLAARIVIAAVVYVGALWLFGANILKESIAYLRKK
jgi:O-antigen/teichoic acid export membrane protein